MSADTKIRSLAYIDEAWVAADNGATFAVTDPATGDEIAHVPDMGAAETERAIAAATKALPAWRKKTAKERSDILRRFHDLMMADQDRLARLMTSEQGKPLAEARGEVAYAASFLSWFAEEARRSYGDVVPSHRADARIVVLKQPVGINEGVISTEVAPFGGIKQSGLGREGSRYGIDEYLEMKYVLFGGVDG